MSEQNLEPSERVLPPSPVLQQAAREAANRWLVRFTPVLDDPGQLSADDCRKALAALPSLREDGVKVLTDLRAQADAADGELLGTLRDGLAQLDGIVRDLRQRLLQVAPNDPQAAPDLDKIRTRLAEAQARHEVEAVTGSATISETGHLEQKVGKGSLGGALFMGVFSFGWLSFTTFHMIGMMGGMSQVFHGFSFLLLGFYAIFYFAGLAMAWAAIMAASSEYLKLDGKTATVRRELGPIKWNQQCTLGRESRAYVASAGSQNNVPTFQVALKGQDGKELRFGGSLAKYEREQLVKQLNDYLGVS